MIFLQRMQFQFMKTLQSLIYIDVVTHYKEELKKLEEYQLNKHKTIDCEITDNVNRENSGRGK